MPDFIDYFLIDAPGNDTKSIDKMIIVNTCAINFLEFDADIYDYLDALADADIDPYEHLQNVQEQLLSEAKIISSKYG